MGFGRFRDKGGNEAMAKTSVPGRNSTWTAQRAPATSRWSPLTPLLQRSPQVVLALYGSAASFTLHYSV
eukprot:scaffold7634_cov51-Prasinocladus_malaysianus.AAC.1